MEFLYQTAIEAALAAGKLIRKYQHVDVQVEQKEGGSSLASKVVTEVDKTSEQIILSHILPTCKKYDLALLSEESLDDGSRFEKDYFWCIDPMDGTLAFINRHAGYSVSIALVSKDGEPQIGVVYDPVTDTLYHARKGKGAFKNHKELMIENRNQHLTYVTDKKLADTPNAEGIQKFLDEKARALKLSGVKVISGGGAVLNGMLVLENGPACMLKYPKAEEGGGSIWDYAATACIFQELGLAVSDYHKETLDLNKRGGTFMNESGVFYRNFEIG